MEKILEGLFLIFVRTVLLIVLETFIEVIEEYFSKKGGNIRNVIIVGIASFRNITAIQKI